MSAVLCCAVLCCADSLPKCVAEKMTGPVMCSQTRDPAGAKLLAWMKDQSGGGYLTTQEVCYTCPHTLQASTYAPASVQAAPDT